VAGGSAGAVVVFFGVAVSLGVAAGLGATVRSLVDEDGVVELFEFWASPKLASVNTKDKIMKNRFSIRDCSSSGDSI
jgi:hypothetical protein